MPNITIGGKQYERTPIHYFTTVVNNVRYYHSFASVGRFDMPGYEEISKAEFEKGAATVPSGRVQRAKESPYVWADIGQGREATRVENVQRYQESQKGLAAGTLRPITFPGGGVGYVPVGSPADINLQGKPDFKTLGSLGAPAPTTGGFGPSPYTGVSIVDYLKSIGQPSDTASRAALAAQRGITNYTGTAAQNTQLLNTLRGGAAVSTEPVNQGNVGDIGTWIDPATGRGYSGPKEDASHMRSDPKTGKELTAMTAPTIDEITTGLIEPSQTIDIEPPPPPSKTEGGTIDSAEVAIKTIEDYIKVLTGTTTVAAKEETDILARMNELLGEAGGKTAMLAEEEEKAGVPKITEQLKNIQNEIMIKLAAFKQLYADIEGKPMTMASIIGSEAQARKVAQADIEFLEAQSLALQNNLSFAQETAQKAVDTRYGPIEEELRIKAMQLELVQGQLSKEEKIRAAALTMYYNDQKQAIADKKTAEKQWTDWLLQQMNKYPSAGINFKDTAETAKAKILDSVEYTEARDKASTETAVFSDDTTGKEYNLATASGLNEFKADYPDYTYEDMNAFLDKNIKGMDASTRKGLLDRSDFKSVKEIEKETEREYDVDFYATATRNALKADYKKSVSDFITTMKKNFKDLTDADLSSLKELFISEQKIVSELGWFARKAYFKD